MRSRTFLFAFVAIAGSLVLPIVAHASIPFFGPIVPDTINRCAAGWGAVIIVINNIIELLITLGLVLLLPIMVAYAGFIIVTSQGNPGAITKARQMVLNTVIGIIVALAAWLIVDALMAVLTAEPNGGTTFARNWSSIINSGGQNPCLIQAGALQNLSQSNLGVTGVSASGNTVSVSGKSGALCSNSNTACSVSAIQQEAQALNITLSSAQATALSCIAVTESSGNPGTPNSSTGACGTFQITTQPGNWSVPVYHQGQCSTSSSCNDAQCNLQTALIMFGKQGYQPWTGKNPNGTYWNPNAVACVQQYNGQ